MRNLHHLTDSALDAFERHKAKLKDGGTEGSLFLALYSFPIRSPP